MLRGVLAVANTLACRKKTMDALIQRAIAAHIAGDYSQAIAGYRRLMVLDPGMIDPRHLMGLAYARNGQVVKGLRLILGALRAVPTHSVASTNLDNILETCPFAPLSMMSFTDLGVPDEGRGAFPHTPGSWHVQVHPDQPFDLPQLPSVETSPGAAEPDLFARAGYPFAVSQRTGAATLTKLEGVYLHTATSALFNDDSLFLESCVRLGAGETAETVSYDSPSSAFNYTDILLARKVTDFKNGTTKNKFSVQTSIIKDAYEVNFPCVFLFGASNYYHWILENLTRIQVLKDSGADVKDFHYVICGENDPIVMESLAKFGITSQQVIFLKRQLYHFRSLIVPSLLVPAAQVAPRTVTCLRGLPWRAAAEGPRRLYVSRNDAVIRRVSNEADILERLAPYGVTPVTLRGCTLDEQRALFAGAELVVAPHGAALANMVFCSPGTGLVELSPHRWHPCFGELAALAGCRHRIVFPRNETHKIARVPATYAAGTNPLTMEFDPDQVEAAVRRALNGGR